MTGRVLARGRSFKRLASYLKTGKDGRQRQRDRVEWVECRSLPTRNPDTAACMMAATASESVSGTEIAVYHFSISCDPGDPVDGGTLRQVADRTIRDLGLEEYQVLIFAHKDRSHPHLHFVVNRVHPERHTLWRTWRDYYRIERSLRAQEQELGLRIVPGWNSVVVRDLDGGLRVPGEHDTGLQRAFPRSGPRRGDADFLRDVTVRAAPVLEQARSWAELERGLAEQGLSLRAKGGGFTLTDGARQVKASEVGRGCSRYHLEKRLGAYPDYRARMAVAGIAPAHRPHVIQPEVTRPQRPAPVEAQAAARPQVPPAPIPTRRRSQFGDAGHGIQELFGSLPPHKVEPPTPPVEHAPEPQPQRKAPTFLREVQERAVPVLERASSWAEVERGLADHGLLLREKGGGFVVTDGEREVKASEVGRAFSRFHLEKRLGQYPDSRPRGSVEEVAPVPPAPVVEPGPAARQAEPLALPLPAPAVQEGTQAETRGAPRFTLYDDGTTFGVQDWDGQVFFAETRERALAEVERANAIVALYPDVISMRHLREMHGAWRDARGLPQLPDPKGRRIVVPAPEGMREGVPLFQPVARVQHETPAPAAPPAAPENSIPALPAELGVPVQQPALPAYAMQLRIPYPDAAARSRPSEQPPELPAPVQQPASTSPAPIAEPEIPLTAPEAAARPQAPEQPPETPAPVQQQPSAPEPPARRQAEPRASTPPPRSPVRRRQRAAPRRMRTQPPTERDKYREVSWRFKDQLAILYRDPRAARRAFDVELAFAGSERALRTLADAPEKYGQLRVLANSEQVAATVRWAKFYANWQTGGTRPARIAVTDLVNAAAFTTAVQKALRDAEASLPEAVDKRELLKKRDADADAALVKVRTTANEVYVDRKEAIRAISAHHRTHGRDATVTAIQAAPEQFGALRPDEHQGALSRLVRGPQTRDARYRAWQLGHEVGAAYRAMEAKPTPEDHVRAEQAVEDAKRALDAANRRWRELWRVSAAEYVREAARVLRYAASESGQSVDSIMNQLMPRLPTGAVPQAWTVLDEVHRPLVDPRQSAVGWWQSTVGREKPRSPGIDI